MWLLILLIAGLALAANRQQQANSQRQSPSQPTNFLAPISDIISKIVRSYPPVRPGLGLNPGAPLNANSNIVLAGPQVSGPYYLQPPAPVAAPSGGGGTSGGTPSGTGSGGVGFAPPTTFRGPSVL